MIFSIYLNRRVFVMGGGGGGGGAGGTLLVSLANVLLCPLKGNRYSHMYKTFIMTNPG